MLGSSGRWKGSDITVSLSFRAGAAISQAQRAQTMWCAVRDMGSDVHNGKGQTAFENVRFRALPRGKSIIQLDPKISRGALQLGMTKQQLGGPEITRFAIEHRDLGAPQAVRAVLGWLQSDSPQIMRLGNSKPSGSPRRTLSQSASDRLACSVISNCTGRRAFCWITIARRRKRTRRDHIRHPQRDDVASSQLACAGRFIGRY